MEKNFFAHIEKNVPEVDFSIWIKPLKIEHNGNLYTLICPHKFFIEWVKNKYHEIIVDAIKKITYKKDIIVEYVISDNNLNQTKPVVKKIKKSQPSVGPQKDFFGKPENKKPTEIKKTGNQNSTHYDTSDALNFSQELMGFEDALSLPKMQINSHFGSLLKKQYTFDNFIVGKANEIARAAALQASMSPGEMHNPLFIYGGSGLGKTHLMHAIGNHVKANNEDAKVLYVTSERYIKDYVDAIRLSSVDEFQNYYRSVDILLVDDIQFIAGKSSTQEEFFHTFNVLFEQSKQVVLSCDKYPNEIPKLESRLASRFSYGLTATIDVPDLETRTAILLQKAKNANCVISQNVALYIAHKIRSNVRELEGVLTRVITFARFNKRLIDEKLVQECLGDVISIQEKIIKIDNIQQIVANYYNIKITDLLSKQRTRQVAFPRQVAMTLARELTTHSLPEIGNWFGGRDHTTVMHAVKSIKKLKENDVQIKEDYQNLIRKLSR